uniref:Ig-like domain-containing protein n=1 Tax=Salarias fasciatus TaxID=181472 RepID=A0A672HC28_SALFA
MRVRRLLMQMTHREKYLPSAYMCVHACLPCTEEDCVLGIVGRPVALPCFYPELLKSENVSIEWRRDGEVVLRSVWQGDKHEQMWGFSVATLAHDAASTGNFSLELPKVDPQEDRTNYSLFIISEESQSRTDGEAGDKTAFLCQSSGGYPKPTVSWLINNTEEPPEGAVRTLAVTLDSLLYNITSYLMVNISKDATSLSVYKWFKQPKLHLAQKLKIKDLKQNI